MALAHLQIPNNLNDDLQQRLSKIQEWKQHEFSPVYIKEQISSYREHLFSAFQNDEPVEYLVYLFADYIDEVLKLIWQEKGLSQFEFLSLVAVGGYGRKELHPYSDVDILVLLEEDRKDANESISEFVTLLWDLGLDIGHSVRTVDECFSEAKGDITIATNIMEARSLAGSDEILNKMKDATSANKIWNSLDFFIAKRDEQYQRHKKHNNTEYNLEPDIKEAPGGLRDIQMIGWVAKRHFACENLYGLVEHNFLSEEEYKALTECQSFLWKIRFALHNHCQRPENKLLFDHQRSIAASLGFKDTDQSLGIEQLMKQYYRCVVEITELNDMLLQHFEESIVNINKDDDTRDVDDNFLVRNDYIEAREADLFAKQPKAMLEIFKILGDDNNIKGIHIDTIRQIRQYKHLIDQDFRNNSENAKAFLDILLVQHSVFYQLKRMKRYGILGNYIPEFERIIGQMQYDLFHIYTVDAHTLLLIKNLRRFHYLSHKELFPIAHSVINSLPKITNLYIAAIFHDIGKGSGRDHSELGAELIIPFMKRHNFSEWDIELASWLVKSHLLISMTIQRKDLADPEVIAEFAENVGSQIRLDYLYVLTVADVCATNPELWNGWKASLFRELYTKTKQFFRRGLENSNQDSEKQKQSLCQDRKTDAELILASDNLDTEKVRQFWSKLGDEYFIRHNGVDIAWHTEAILNHEDDNKPLVVVRESGNQYQAATQVLTYTLDSNNLFATSVSLLSQLGLSVVDARILSPSETHSLNTFIVIDENNELLDASRYQEIQEVLSKALARPEDFPTIIKKTVNKRVPRQIKHFDFKTQVTISNNDNSPFTVVEIRALDRPGVLAKIGAIFMEFNLQLHNAKISTLGEVVEDLFFVSDLDKQKLEDPQLLDEMRNIIKTRLNQMD